MTYKSIWGTHTSHVRNHVSDTTHSAQKNATHSAEDMHTSLANVGRSTWTLMHTAAQRADSDEKAADIAALVHAVSQTFPCEKCASHMRAYLAQNPIKSNPTPRDVQLYVCEFHNNVNQKTHKNVVFDCSHENLERAWGVRKDTCGKMTCNKSA